MKVRELTKDEYIDLLHTHNAYYSYTQGEHFITRLEKHNYKLRFFAGYEKEDLKLSMYMAENALMKIFKYYYSPYGFVVFGDSLPDESEIRDFMYGIEKYIKGWNVAGIKFDSSIELKQLDKLGRSVESGFDNLAFRNVLEKSGCILTPLKITHSKTCNPRQVAILDLVELDNWQGYEYPEPKIVQHYTQEELFKNLSSRIRQRIKTSNAEYLSVQEISASDLHTLAMKSGDFGGFGSAVPSLDTIAQLKKAFGSDCQINGVFLDGHKYCETLETKIQNLEKEEQKLLKKNQNGHTVNKLKQTQESLTKQKKLLDKYSHLSFNDHILIAGALFIHCNHQMFYGVSGIDRDYTDFNANYRLQWDIICKAVDNGDWFYNMLGIAGDYSKEDTKNRGLIKFKQYFNCRLAEYIGCSYWPINKWACNKLIERVPE